MSNNPNVPSITLQTAVLMQVKEFAQNNQSFSVHDITRVIRSKVQSGELEIPEVEVSGSSFRFDIPHVKVKALVDELWRTGMFDSDLSLNRTFNGRYFDYTTTVNVSNNSSIASTTSNIPSVANALNSQVPVSPAQTPYPSVPVSNTSVRPAKQGVNNVVDNINKYLVHCNQKQMNPTLKKVQSAIKRKHSSGWTCAEILNIVQTLGFKVNNTSYGSFAEVVTY